MLLPLLNGRYNVSYNDINELAYPVLRHRMKLTFEAIAERISPDDIVKMIIKEVGKRYKLVAVDDIDVFEDAEGEVAATEGGEKTMSKKELKAAKKKAKNRE